MIMAQNNFQEFLEFCKGHLKSHPDLVKLIEKRYQDCSVSYTSTSAFHDAVCIAQAKIDSDSKRIYVYLRDFLNELKANRMGKHGGVSKNKRCREDDFDEPKAKYIKKENNSELGPGTDFVNSESSSSDKAKCQTSNNLKMSGFHNSFEKFTLTNPSKSSFNDTFENFVSREDLSLPKQKTEDPSSKSSAASSETESKERLSTGKCSSGGLMLSENVIPESVVESGQSSPKQEHIEKSDLQLNTDVQSDIQTDTKSKNETDAELTGNTKSADDIIQCISSDESSNAGDIHHEGKDDADSVTSNSDSEKIKVESFNSKDQKRTKPSEQGGLECVYTVVKEGNKRKKVKQGADDQDVLMEVTGIRVKNIDDDINDDDNEEIDDNIDNDNDDNDDNDSNDDINDDREENSSDYCVIILDSTDNSLDSHAEVRSQENCVKNTSDTTEIHPTMEVKTERSSTSVFSPSSKPQSTFNVISVVAKLKAKGSKTLEILNSGTSSDVCSRSHLGSKPAQLKSCVDADEIKQEAVIVSSLASEKECETDSEIEMKSDTETCSDEIKTEMELASHATEVVTDLEDVKLPESEETRNCPDISNDEETEDSLSEQTATISATREEDSASENKIEQAPKKKGSKKQIEKLEKLLQDIKNKIEELRRREVCLDDLDDEESAYILEDKYQRKFVKVWNKLCELNESATTTGRSVEKRFRYDGTRYPEINQKIERFINKSKVFPDYQDIRHVITRVNLKQKLGLGSSLLDSIAREAFTDVGYELQKRRKKDFKDSLQDHEIMDKDSGAVVDPALKDVELRKKLDDNKKVSRNNLEEVLQKYVRKQMERTTESGGSDDDENDEDKNDDQSQNSEEEEVDVPELDNILKEDSKQSESNIHPEEEEKETISGNLQPSSQSLRESSGSIKSEVNDPESTISVLPNEESDNDCPPEDSSNDPATPDSSSEVISPASKKLHSPQIKLIKLSDIKGPSISSGNKNGLQIKGVKSLTNITNGGGICDDRTGQICSNNNNSEISDEDDDNDVQIISDSEDLSTEDKQRDNKVIIPTKYKASPLKRIKLIKNFRSVESPLKNQQETTKPVKSITSPVGSSDKTGENVVSSSVVDDSDEDCIILD